MPFSARPTRRRFLAATAVLAAGIANRRLLAQPSQAAGCKLHFAQPATRWPDALPVGNGRLGAMVFGSPWLERIQLNEESIWCGQPGLDRNNPRAATAVPRIRELLFAGHIAEAEALATTDMLAIPRRMPCYQTLGDLHLDFSAMGLTPQTRVEDYRLELDLDTAICTTTFTHGGTRYTREAFSSAPDQVIVIRLTASEREKLAFSARLDRPAPTPFVSASDRPGSITLDGQALPVNDNPGLPDKEPRTGVRFHARLLAMVEDRRFGLLPDGHTGSPTGSDGTLAIDKATSVTLLIDCATSYRYPSSTASPMRLVEGDAAAMRAAVTQNLTAAARIPYAQLRQRHIEDHQQYFRRAAFNLGPDPRAAIPTDTRVQAIKDGREDPHLYPLYFQFGRYLLISSSRPKALAANLQGIWNESVDPPWGSKYTININAQMNYWLADRANLADLHPPLFDLLESTRPQGTRTARAYYKARGSVAHHNTDIWGDAVPIDGLGGGIWAMGSAWLALHFWDHYDYTRDSGFLRSRALPALRENVLFLFDYLIESPPGTPYAGHLVSGPSCSPENKYTTDSGKSFNLCMSPTMDIAITRAVLSRFAQAASLLNVEPALKSRAEAALQQLPPYRVLPDGRLAEWPEDFKDQEPGHRHISHLFGLFPESQITLGTTPDLARAARATLDARLAAGSGSTGWSRSWITACMARLHDGDACWANLLALVRQCTRHNLFDVCGLKENSPFQIDGNLGAPAAITEMLLQSHEPGPKGVPLVRLLPALPGAWPDGTFTGLRIRGGAMVDLTWNNGRATRAVLRSTVPATFVVVAPPRQQIAQSGPGASFRDAGSELLLQMAPGREIELVFPALDGTR